MTHHNQPPQSQAPRVKKPLAVWDRFKDDPALQTYFKSPFTKVLLEQLDLAKERLERNADYDCPSWAYKQADINGRLAIIDLIKGILNDR